MSVWPFYKIISHLLAVSVRVPPAAEVVVACLDQLHRRVCGHAQHLVRIGVGRIPCRRITASTFGAPTVRVRSHAPSGTMAAVHLGAVGGKAGCGGGVELAKQLIAREGHVVVHAAFVGRNAVLVTSLSMPFSIRVL